MVLSLESKGILSEDDKATEVEKILSPCYRLLESDELRIRPSEYIQASSERDTDISIVPWLGLICIDLYSFLVALCPSILVRVVTQPFHVLAIDGITFEFFFTTRIE